MISASFRVEGNDLKKLVTYLKTELVEYRLQTYDYFSVLFYEKYYVRITSTLLTVVVFDFTKPGQCRIDITTGGGKANSSAITGAVLGFSNVSLGSEDSSTEKIVELIKRYCYYNKCRLTPVND